MKSSTPIHRPLGPLALSTTKSPLFIIHFTLLSTTLMSASGSPSTATKSPRYPGATASVHTFPCPSHNFPNRTAFTDCAATFACPNAPGTKITIHAINATRTILIALLSFRQPPTLAIAPSLHGSLHDRGTQMCCDCRGLVRGVGL